MTLITYRKSWVADILHFVYIKNIFIQAWRLFCGCCVETSWPSTNLLSPLFENDRNRLLILDGSSLHNTHITKSVSSF